jgi:hypothetical protein
VDWFVLLTPLMVLAVISILGFTGCDLVFTVDPRTPTELKLVVKVPVQLTVNQNQFQFTQPGSTVLESVTALDRVDDGSGIVVLTHTLKDPATGTWEVTCRMDVQDNVRQATASTAGGFTLDPEASGDVIFETAGRPSNNDFRVIFIGFAATG